MNNDYVEFFKQALKKEIAIHKSKYGNNLGVADVKRILNDPTNQSHPAYFMFKGVIGDSALSDENLVALTEALNKL